MKKLFKFSAVSLCAVMAMSVSTASAGALSVSTVNCANSNSVVLALKGCSSTNLNNILEQCGVDCSADDLQDLIKNCGILLNESQCFTCESDTAQPTTEPTESSQSTDQAQPTTPTQSTTQPTTSQSKDYSVSDFEQQVVDLVNEQRASYGLEPLTLNTELSRVARIKSEDMRDNGYFSHTSPTYGTPFEMMKSFGISYRTAGENIAMGQTTPQAVVNAWMNSEGHRANILNSSFTQIGVGYASNGNYWTQMFIG